MSYSTLPTRTSADANASADSNQLETNITDWYISASTNSTQTLTVTSPKRIQYTPTADHDVVLQTTSVPAGRGQWIGNSSTAYKLTLKSSDGDTHQIITPNSWVYVVSQQATPTDATHWKTKDAGGGWVSAATVAGDFSSGFGTVSAITSKILRIGPNAILSGVATVGTVTTASGIMTLPFSLALSTGSFAATLLKSFGPGYQLTSSGVSLATDGIMLQWVYDSGSSSGVRLARNVTSLAFQASTVDNILTSDSKLTWELVVPISGWEIG